MIRTAFIPVILVFLFSAAVPAESSAVEEDKEYLLRQASANGELSNMQNLLARGADVNGKNMRGYTALILAVRGDQTYAVKFLIGNGADVNAQDVDGDSPLRLAVTNGNSEFASLLLSSGADPDLRDTRGMTPLMQACELNKPDIAEILLNYRASIAVRDKDGNTPLLIAARTGSTEIVNQLLTKGADVRAQTPYGDSAEALALRFQHAETAAVLASFEAQHPRKAEEPPATAVVAQQTAADAVSPASREMPATGKASSSQGSGDGAIHPALAILCVLAMTLLF
ncbi:MAG: ankyrin repeat domain-containing protein [Nitrospiraceae bacterium]|nr:ankyrin repeat domain-containing protein [Nitrospiraceae bacterium]